MSRWIYDVGIKTMPDIGIGPRHWPAQEGVTVIVKALRAEPA